MERQRNMSRMKEWNKAPGKELNKLETSKLPYAEFEMLLLTMLYDLSENFSKVMGNIKMLTENQNPKKNQSGLRNTATKIKISLEQ